MREQCPSLFGHTFFHSALSSWLYSTWLDSGQLDSSEETGNFLSASSLQS